MPLGAFLLLIAIGQHSDALLGEYALVMSCYFIMQMLPLLGLTPYVMREVARAPERAGTYFSTIGLLSLVACVVVDAVAIVLVRLAGYPEDVLRALAVMGVLIFPGIILFIAEILFMSARRTRPIAWVAILENVVRVAASVVALALGGGLVALVVVFLATRVGALAAYIVCLRRMHIVERLEVPDRALLRETVRLLPSFFSGTLLFAVFSRLDFIALSVWEPVEQVGYYAIGYRLFEIGIMVLSALVMAAFPWAARVYSRTPRRFPAAARNLIALMAVGIGFVSFAGVLLADIYVKLLFANQFPRPVLLTQLFLAALLLAGVDYVLSALLHASDGQRDDTRAMMAAGVVQVVLLVALIPPYGIYGAFIAKAVGHAIQGLLRYALLQRRFGSLLASGMALRVLVLLAALALAAWLLVGAAWWLRFAAVALAGGAVVPLAAIGLGILRPLRLLRYFWRTRGCTDVNTWRDLFDRVAADAREHARQVRREARTSASRPAAADHRLAAALLHRAARHFHLNGRQRLARLLASCGGAMTRMPIDAGSPEGPGWGRT